MRKKGFTLIELLVVITIIAMLLAILMPALNKVKKLAARLVCGTNVKGLGTAMFVYGHDYDGSFPVQGGKGTHSWTGLTGGWQNSNKDWSVDGNISVGASLYMLVREVDVPTASFICKSGGQKAYDGANDNNLDMVELFDFGNYNWATSPGKTGPKMCVSYAYQSPYSVGGNTAYPPNGEMFGSFAVLADKNPWYDSKITSEAASLADYDSKTYIDWVGKINHDLADPWDDVAPKYKLQVGNSEAHGREGQNILYTDGSAQFKRRPDVGAENDNIYTNFAGPGPYDTDDKRQGAGASTIGSGRPKSEADSFLINDDDNDGTL